MPLDIHYECLSRKQGPFFLFEVTFSAADRAV